MKQLIILSFLCLVMAACGTQDNKNEVEHYPTYDTTDKTRPINDSVSNDGMRSGGNLRHNVDQNESPEQ